MVKIIAGVKGSGKTKQLVDMVRTAVAAENGDVVVIEKDKTLTYDIPYQARLIDAAEYNIGTYEFLKGFLCGIHAGNYDITHVFVDNFMKLVSDNSIEALGTFLKWLEVASARANIEYVLSISADTAGFSEDMKKYLI